MLILSIMWASAATLLPPHHPSPVEKPSLLVLPAWQEEEGRIETEPSILHSAVGVMLGFLSRGCGERVSLSRSPVLNSKWPTNGPADADARQSRANTEGWTAKRRGRGLRGEPGPPVGRVCLECGITLQLVFFLKIASGGRARQSSGGAKPAHAREMEQHLFFRRERERENKERKIKLGAVQHFQRCQAR